MNPIVNVVGGLLTILAVSSPVFAQTTEASYPLLTDLLDTTANYGPVMLIGNPTPPAPPADGVCVNGIYLNYGGQDVRTPQITNLNTDDFQFSVEFNLAAFSAESSSPVLMGGNHFRWIGIHVRSDGAIGLRHNNSNWSWSTTNVTTSKWYIATVKFDAGTAELYLDGVMVHQVMVGSLVTGNNLNFTTNDFAAGSNHNGCIRNLVIANGPTVFRDGFESVSE